MKRTFASDNTAPAAPEILRALVEANTGDAISYGEDEWTRKAGEKLRRVFGEETDVYFAFNGTGANVVALSCLVEPFQAVIAPASAHLQTDECGAFERFTGCKVLPVAATDGKLTIADLQPFAGSSRDRHHAQPRVLSISQSTEYGTLYGAGELAELCRFAHAQGWYVHVDGARIANAAAALGMGLRESTRDLGVDVLTFGGTKNGMVLGEAILFFDPSIHRGAAPYAQKQGMQLASKMRFIAAQFISLLENERWRDQALHANAMARRLETHLRTISGVRITRPVECNAVFAMLDRAAIPQLQREYYFHVFDEALPEVRWMTHHATQPRDVDDFAALIKRAVSTQAD
jgi:threonine aldolase